MGLLEWRNPGGAPRDGVLGLHTTRGDRLFLSLLGSAFIFLGWLAIAGPPLWGGLVLANPVDHLHVREDLGGSSRRHLANARLRRGSNYGRDPKPPVIR